MAKVNGKRIRRKKIKKSANNVATEVVNHPPVPHVNSALAMAPVVNSSGTPTQRKEELSGYIFMCSGTTKPECYVNRVFGLPAGRRETVEKIKPGAKLFLFDFDVKLLYGVYEADSLGGMNLQPTAFGGRFPAQVKFKICKDCLPLPLNSFRTAIKDNFQGSKFAQELNDQQVRDLLLLFKPIVARPSATLHLPVPTAAYEPWVHPPPPSGAPVPWMPPAARDGQLNPSSNPLLQKRYQPHTAMPLHNHSQQTNVPQFVHNDGLNPYPYLHHLSATHQALGAHVNPHQFAENQPPYFSNEHPKNLQEPHLRHLTIPAAYPHDHSVGFNGGYNGLAKQTVMNHIDQTHGQNPYPTPTPTPFYGSTSSPFSGLSYTHSQPSMPVSSPYSGQTYMRSQPSMPVSSSYSFVGGTQIYR